MDISWLSDKVIAFQCGQNSSKITTKDSTMKILSELLKGEQIYTALAILPGDDDRTVVFFLTSQRRCIEKIKKCYVSFRSRSYAS